MDLWLVPGFRQFCGQFCRPWKMGQGNQERLDLYAGKVGGQRKNALQNGPAFNQAAGAGLAFLIALLVHQNLLAVLKLPDFLQDFFALVFFLFRLGRKSNRSWRW